MTYKHLTRWAQSPASLEPELSVVISTHNDADRIVSMIVSIAAQLFEVTADFEIIVSDDGSTDGTPQVIRDLGLRNVFVLDLGVRRGGDAAVRVGMRAANGRRVLLCDTDMATPMRDVINLIRRLDGGGDDAVAFREAQGAKRAQETPRTQGTHGTQEAQRTHGTQEAKGAPGTEGVGRPAKLLASACRRHVESPAREVGQANFGRHAANTKFCFTLFTREAADAHLAAGRADGTSVDLRQCRPRHAPGLAWPARVAHH